MKPPSRYISIPQRKKQKKSKKVTSLIEQKGTLYTKGNAYLYVIEGYVVPSSSLQLPLVKQRDITLTTKKQDLGIENRFQEKTFFNGEEN